MSTEEKETEEHEYCPRPDMHILFKKLKAILQDHEQRLKALEAKTQKL